MPDLQLKTIESKKVWSSPDGQRTIYELTLEYKGNPVKAKTYSNQIAEVGWEGIATTYEKTGKTGVETFVKQPPKEGGSFGGSTSPTSKTTRSSFQPKDEAAIKAMFAIKAACSVTPVPQPDAPLAGYMANIEATAQELFAMVDRVKATPVDPIVPDPVVVPTDAQLESVEQEVGKAIDDISKVFDDAQEAVELEEGEDPWQPKKT